MTPLNLIIPAAGAGIRFRNVGINTPKPLIDVFGIPMLFWVIRNFKLSSEDTVTIVSQKSDELPMKMRDHIQSHPSNFQFIEIEGLTTGPASTVALALGSINLELPLIVANSDQFVSGDLFPFVEATTSKKFDGVILVMQASGDKWSYVGRDPAGGINKVVEKVEISSEATVGIYGWKDGYTCKFTIEKQFAQNSQVNGEFYIAPSYNYLLQSGGSIETVSVGIHGEKVHGLGTPEDLKKFLESSNHEQMKSYLY